MITTILLSKKGGFLVRINEILDKESDGFKYKVLETGKVFDSQKMAINNGRQHLKKLRKYLDENPIKQIETQIIIRRRTKWN